LYSLQNIYKAPERLEALEGDVEALGTQIRLQARVNTSLAQQFYQHSSHAGTANVMSSPRGMTFIAAELSMLWQEHFLHQKNMQRIP
jgi:hypothetical protein